MVEKRLMFWREGNERSTAVVAAAVAMKEEEEKDPNREAGTKVVRARESAIFAFRLAQEMWM